MHQMWPPLLRIEGRRLLAVEGVTRLGGFLLIQVVQWKAGPDVLLRGLFNNQFIKEKA